MNLNARLLFGGALRQFGNKRSRNSWSPRALPFRGETMPQASAPQMVFDDETDAHQYYFMQDNVDHASSGGLDGIVDGSASFVFARLIPATTIPISAPLRECRFEGARSDGTRLRRRRRATRGRTARREAALRRGEIRRVQHDWLTWVKEPRYRGHIKDARSLRLYPLSRPDFLRQTVVRGSDARHGARPDQKRSPAPS